MRAVLNRIHVLMLTCLISMFIGQVIGRENLHSQSHSQPIQINAEDLPELPVYIGSGYNVFYGNPKSQNGLDPGFYNNVFHYTYDHNKTTDDYKFKTPDQISTRKMSTCSFSTEVNSFLGTHSYQNDLKLIADLNAAGNFSNTYAFSMSEGYQKIKSLTLNEKTTTTHATAECECYELLQNKFTPPTLKENFIDGAIECYNKKNWNPFIEQFGTHYIHEVIMGGRATQQIEYSYRSFAMMQSLNADINITARASFAKSMADTSFDWAKYAKDVSYSESVSTIRKFVYIGGETPRSGKIIDWQEKIGSSPMPIKYKLFSLSELFSQIHNSKFDRSKAASQLESGIRKYCATKDCPGPRKDFEKPPSATVDIVNSTVYGTQAGTKFESFFKSTTLDMKRVLMTNSTSVISSIQLMLSDGVTDLYTEQAGSPGTQVTWEVPKGDNIVQIQVRYTSIISSLTFITSKGVKSPKFGGNNGTYALVTIPKDYRVIGIFGQKGGALQKLGFVFGKTIYPTPPSDLEPEIDVIMQEI